MSIPFRTTRRVDFADTDMAGIVHFSNYFRFMESAEIDFLQSRGLSVSWSAGGVKWGLPRVSASCDFLKPVRFLDVLSIAVIVEEVGTKSIRYRFEFTDRQNEQVAVGRVTAVHCRHAEAGGLEAVEIPAELRSKLGA